MAGRDRPLEGGERFLPSTGEGEGGGLGVKDFLAGGLGGERALEHARGLLETSLVHEDDAMVVKVVRIPEPGKLRMQPALADLHVGARAVEDFGLAREVADDFLEEILRLGEIPLLKDLHRSGELLDGLLLSGRTRDGNL